MEKDSRIFVGGHKGMVGSAIVRKLKSLGYTNIMTVDKKQVDLVHQHSVNQFFNLERPEYVFLAAAKVGGIKANSDYKADFIYENIMIQSNVIHACFQNDVKKLIFLGSSCIYPKYSEQPIKEEYLLSGHLEESNDAYAIAKITGIKMCQSFNKQYGTDFISVMPCNLYGVGDNYHPEKSHVFPAIIRKLHEAKIKGEKEILLWGDGSPLREFLCSDDVADACVYLMNSKTKYDMINVGSGSDLSIKDLAEKMRDIIYSECRIVFNGEVSINGTPKKLMDSSKINELGWFPTISLEEGIKLSYSDFLSKN
jgi:GDP-L-fucose synthase